MKYNLANIQEANAAFQYLTDLVGLEAVAEVKKVHPHRTINQNSFLHLLLNYFGVETGYTLAESKYLYKNVNAGLYRYEKNSVKFLRSTADLTKEDMQKSINRFMEWSKEKGIELPTVIDDAFMRWAENETERNSNHL